jgi:hypothetical protein
MVSNGGTATHVSNFYSPLAFMPFPSNYSKTDRKFKRERERERERAREVG